MKLSLKNSFYFAIYQIVLLWFFDIFSFFSEPKKAIYTYSVAFVLLVIIHFLTLFIILKTSEGKKNNRLFNSISYIFSALFSAIFFWSIFDGELSILLIVISAFTIPALLPAIIFFLKSIFQENESELIVSNNSSKEKNEIISPIEEKLEELHFILENESGKVLLDVFISQIICFEANDNYVVTYFMNKQNELKKSMERISLKKIEEILSNLEVSTFSRVHKSYLIHNEFIEEIKGKAQAQKIKMKNLEILVPVSRTFQVAALKTW